MTLEEDLNDVLKSYRKLWMYDMSDELIQLVWINEKQIKNLIENKKIFAKNEGY